MKDNYFLAKKFEEDFDRGNIEIRLFEIRKILFFNHKKDITNKISNIELKRRFSSVNIEVDYFTKNINGYFNEDVSEDEISDFYKNGEIRKDDILNNLLKRNVYVVISKRD